MATLFNLKGSSVHQGLIALLVFYFVTFSGAAASDDAFRVRIIQPEQESADDAFDVIELDNTRSVETASAVGSPGATRVSDVIASPSPPAISAVADTMEAQQPECDICSQLSLTRQQLDYVHTEMAKQMILNKLRMSEPPNITRPLPTIPSALLRQAWSQSNAHHNPSPRDFYAKTERIFIQSQTGS